MKGRKPKPATVHKRRGNPSRLPLRELERRESAAPKAGAIKAPRTMSKKARTFWDYYVEQLDEMGVMRPAYREALVEMCEFLAEAHAHRVAIRRHLSNGNSMYVRTKDGGLKSHPGLTNSRAASQMALRYMAELGLTPASNTRLGVVAEPETGDQLESMLRLVEGG